MLRRSFPAIALLFALATGCGAATNFNKIFGGDDEGADGEVLKAKAAYDRGDFSKASDIAMKLLDRNPDNEEAAIILGYVYLSQGGIDPYRLAREMIKISGTGSSTTTATPDTGAPTLVAADGDANQSSGNASDTLKKLGTLISLSDADWQKLAPTTFDNNGGTVNLFGSDNALIVPAQVTDDLRSSVAVLDYMNKAVKAICRFVNPEVKAEGDARDNSPECAPTTYERHSVVKAHFLWAFSHLTESLVYQSVLLFSGSNDAGSQTHFQKGADEINHFTGDVPTFVNDVTEMKNAVDAVFDTASDTSMITATLRDLDAVTRAFDTLEGLPDSIKTDIKAAMENIKKVGTTLGGADGNTKALKGQMTESLAKTVGTKIDDTIKKKVGNNQDVTPEQVAALPPETQQQISAMCGAYTTLSTGVSAEKTAANKPKACS